jgi:hypothetical protein
VVEGAETDRYLKGSNQTAPTLLQQLSEIMNQSFLRRHLRSAIQKRVYQRLPRRRMMRPRVAKSIPFQDYPAIMKLWTLLRRFAITHIHW